MGLDMYFYGKRYLWSFTTGDKNDPAIAEEIAKLFPEVRGAKFNEVTAEFKYWRKANAIHDWFVREVQDGVDDCGEYSVSTEQLESLRNICEKIIADPEQAEILLPTKSGFFFGGIEYDEYYMQDIQETYNWLNDLLLKESLEMLKDWDFYYRASW